MRAFTVHGIGLADALPASCVTDLYSVGWELHCSECSKEMGVAVKGLI